MAKLSRNTYYYTICDGVGSFSGNQAAEGNSMARSIRLGTAASTILLLIALTIITAAPVRADDCTVPTVLTKTRPDPDGPPTVVNVGVVVMDIIDIIDTAQLFTTDFFVAVSWHDPRLSAEALGYSLEDCAVRKSDIWHPFVDLVNQRDLKSHYQDLLDVDARGNVRVVQRYSGTMVAPLQLHDFPFDRQVLKFSLIALRFEPDEVDLVLDEQFTTVRENLSLAGWDVEGTETTEEVEVLVNGRIKRPRLGFSVIVSRDTTYYIWNVFVPLLLIVFMAWTVFWINPEHFGPQVGLSTAATFTLIAFLLSLRQMVPRVGYLTRSDRLVLFCAVLVFSALGEAVLTSHLFKNGKEDLALRIDRWARFVYPILFIVAAVRSLVF